MSWIKEELPSLIRLAVPAVLAQAAQMGLGFIDIIMAGHHGAQTLAAVSVGSNIFIPIVIIMMGFLLGINPMAATERARNNLRELARILHTGVIVALILGTVCWWLLKHPQPILDWLQLSSNLRSGATEYLDAIAMAGWPMLLFLAFRFFNEGLFANKQVMLVSFSALPVNAITNYYFLFKYNLGPYGLGLATSISYMFMFVALGLYTLVSERYRHLHLFRTAPFASWQVVRKMLKLGTPIAISLGLEVTLFAGIGLLIAQFGDIVVSGHQIALNVASMAFMVPLGISTAATARVGYFYGKEALLMAKRIGLLAVGLSAGMMSISGVVMATMPQSIGKIYTSEPEVLAVVVSLLSIAALFQLFDGIQVTLAGVLRGFHDTFVPMLISFVAYWIIGFGLGHYLAQTLNARGYWYGLVAGLATAAILLSIRFHQLTRSAQNLQTHVP